MNAIARVGLTICILLVLICFGVVVLLREIPPELYRFFGTCLVVSGAVNLLFHKRFGRQNYQWARSLPTFTADPWRRLGIAGAKFLYLGIGIILSCVGTILLGQVLFFL